MKCHSCHNAPAEVGLLCRACVEGNRNRAQRRKDATLEQIRRTTEDDSLIHRASMSWVFKCAVVLAFFGISFAIISSTGQSAKADLQTKLLFAAFVTSSFVSVGSYLWLWMSMYGSDDNMHGIFLLLLSIVFPAAVWRWAALNFERARGALIVHVVASVLLFVTLAALSNHMGTSWYETLSYMAIRHKEGDLYQGTVWEE